MNIVFFFNITDLKEQKGIRHYFNYFLLPGRHLLRTTTSLDPEHDSPGQHPVLQVLQQGQVRAGPRRMRPGGGSQDPDWRGSDRDWREGTLLQMAEKSKIPNIPAQGIHFRCRKLNNNDILAKFLCLTFI